jgi:hypothetical protein
MAYLTDYKQHAELLTRNVSKVVPNLLKFTATLPVLTPVVGSDLKKIKIFSKCKPLAISGSV